MTTFIQLHLLTNYPPANLNRDDLGRPKTAVVGGTQRLRISSQSLKRAWRTSSIFEEELAGNMGIRSKEMGINIFDALTTGMSLEAILSGRKEKEAKKKLADDKANKIATKIASVFGKTKRATKENLNLNLEVEQLVHISPQEITEISEMVEKCRKSGSVPDESDLQLLKKNHKAVDIAMFGRMLAAKPQYSIEAAVQVAHAFSVQKVAVEDDYFTAVDDLNREGDDSGAAHLGVTEFASGLFYLYVCINRDLLLENLSNDSELVDRSLHALGKTAATIGPTGKQSSFASRAYASYILAEKGSQQPRSLSVAFLKPVTAMDDMFGAAVQQLEDTYENMDKSYGKCADKRETMNAHMGKGTLKEILDFIAKE